MLCGTFEFALEHFLQFCTLKSAHYLSNHTKCSAICDDAFFSVEFILHITTLSVMCFALLS